MRLKCDDLSVLRFVRYGKRKWGEGWVVDWGGFCECQLL